MTFAPCQAASDPGLRSSRRQVEPLRAQNGWRWSSPRTTAAWSWLRWTASEMLHLSRQTQQAA